MSAQKWVQNSSGYLELVDPLTGQILLREKKRKPPRTARSGRRGPGRPTKTELAIVQQGSSIISRRLYEIDSDLANAICDAIVCGKKLTQLDLSLGLPPYQEICRFRREDPSFDRQVRIALECRALWFEEAAIAAAVAPISPGEVATARLRFDAYRKAAEWANPARYLRKTATKMKTKTETKSVQFLFSDNTTKKNPKSD